MGANQNSSQNLAYVPKSTRILLLQPDQDCLAIDELSAFGTGLGTVTKAQLRNNLSSLGHFIEHLVSIFGKLPWKNNLDHNSRDSRYGGSIAHPAITCK
jgi:hypothetical protein